MMSRQTDNPNIGLETATSQIKRYIAVGGGIALFIIATLVLVAGISIYSAPKPANADLNSTSAHQRIADCDAKTFNNISPTAVAVADATASQQRYDLLQDISSHCYNEVLGENLIDDFRIRRNAFALQSAQGKVLLWMVVAITMSGVILAGLQLLAAFFLASSGHGVLTGGGAVEISRTSVAVQSSVTGLLILTVSFAFFLVFVIWVYTIDPVQQMAPATANQSEVANKQPTGK